jgi:hypothetical protein
VREGVPAPASCARRDSRTSVDLRMQEGILAPTSVCAPASLVRGTRQKNEKATKIRRHEVEWRGHGGSGPRKRPQRGLRSIAGGETPGRRCRSRCGAPAGRGWVANACFTGPFLSIAPPGLCRLMRRSPGAAPPATDRRPAGASTLNTHARCPRPPSDGAHQHGRTSRQWHPQSVPHPDRRAGSAKRDGAPADGRQGAGHSWALACASGSDQTAGGAADRDGSAIFCRDVPRDDAVIVQRRVRIERSDGFA